MDKDGRKFILSLDGGGVRGIIQLLALEKLEKTTNKLTRDIFSFVGGTSVGAIITAGVVAGLKASEILELFKKNSEEIFQTDIFSPFKRFFLGYLYSSNKLHNLLGQNLGEKAMWNLNNSPIDLLITAKRLKDGKPFYFVKDNKLNTCKCGNLKLIDCATASAAAPTYFSPWQVSHLGKMVDGGVGVTGNPVYQACVEAFYYMDTYPIDKTTIVSLGTGRYPQRGSPGWLFSWLKWVLYELLNSPGEEQTELVQRHFSKATFYRLDPQLTSDIQLDDFGKIDVLIELGRKFVKDINWEDILTGKDTTFKIHPDKTSWYQYKWRSPEANQLEFKHENRH